MLASALRQSWRDGSMRASLPENLMAGITVGVVALPLSMGLAIAVGVPPQHGLYTAIIGGLLIALLGGSRVNISGPTAAFIVILLPIVQQFGLGGLLLSGMMAGLMLLAMGLFKLGRFIQIVPYPVVIGFTAGIGTVIAGLQLNDLLGLNVSSASLHFPQKMADTLAGLADVQLAEALVGISSLVVLFLWKRSASRIPTYLVALLWGTLLALALDFSGWASVETISDRFSYTLNGVIGQGIPPIAPTFALPWALPNAQGQPIGLSWEVVQALFSASLAIAMLGALESLLCAMMADGMTGRQHDPNSELVGQGVGNMLVPFFGGIPATAAIARTALNVRSGGSTPVSAVMHALVLLLIVLLLAPLLSYIPMAAMAAILMGVAWNMSEVPHVLHLLRTAPRADIAVFLTCYGLTVAIDMQVAVAAGMVLAAALFIQRMSAISDVEVLPGDRSDVSLPQREGVVTFVVRGPLFFGVAHKALKIITQVDKSVQVVVLDLKQVPLMDTTAMVNLRSLAEALAQADVRLYLLSPTESVAKKLQRFAQHSSLNIIHDFNDIDLLPISG